MMIVMMSLLMMIVIVRTIYASNGDDAICHIMSSKLSNVQLNSKASKTCV